MFGGTGDHQVTMDFHPSPEPPGLNFFGQAARAFVIQNDLTPRRWVMEQRRRHR